jgi:hypothetical protein
LSFKALPGGPSRTCCELGPWLSSDRPDKPTVIHPFRFPFAADVAAHLFAAAAVRLAQIRRDRRV